MFNKIESIKMTKFKKQEIGIMDLHKKLCGCKQFKK